MRSLSRNLLVCVILVLASAGLYAGWRLFWFLTDDAFIAFRYVSNSVLGYGYTWNLPPFRPVEGYTSFFWVVLLDGVWRVAGVEPPAAANVISLLFAYGTTFLGAAMLLKMDLRERLRRVRPALLALVLLGVLTNRTYLTWTSSGLETAAFNFFVTAWVFCCLFIQPGASRWLGWTALASVLSALTRPDGLLLVGVTLVLGGWTLLRRYKAGCLRPADLVPFAPFLVTGAHFAWRRIEYGDWLPNTFAAKSVAPWPQSGLRYALSFVIEYALWFWIALGVAFLLSRLYLFLRRPAVPSPAAGDSLALPRRSIALAAAGTLFAHFAYYTFMIGGDHFEYRVYSHLVLFAFLSTVWLLNALGATPLRALAFLSLFVACALPIQWTHWAATRDLDTRAETKYLRVPIASWFPAAVRPYVALFDEAQDWLIEHYVCARHQEHKVFYQHQVETLPSRAEGILLSPESYPVVVSGGIGVVGWVLPTTNVLDTHGLVDLVIARNPVDPDCFRMIAHERYPPAGYMECFRPNMRLAGRKFVVAQRGLTADAIVECESRTWLPSKGDTKDTSKYLVIDGDNAPTVDGYLWSVWPPDPLYLYYVPPEQDAAAVNEALLGAFPDYAGRGCIVAPPAEHLAGRGDYVFAFLASSGRPDLANVVEAFPWAGIVTERWMEQPVTYQLGYAAPAGPEVHPWPSHLQSADWGSLSLLGHDLPRTEYRPGEIVHATLYYGVNGTVEASHSIFVHLLGAPGSAAAAGALLGQDDGDPCRGLYPMHLWKPGSAIVGKVVFSIPLGVLPGEYELVTGLYDWQTGERVLPVGSPPGQDSVRVGQIHIRE